MFEVKLWSTKSSVDEPEDPAVKDQLSRYSEGLQERAAAGIPFALVYVTPSPWPPTNELRDSVQSLKLKTEIDPLRTLSWMSWFDVLNVLDENTQADVAVRMARIVGTLRRAGLVVFEGWNRSIEIDPPGGTSPMVAPWLRDPGWPGWNAAHVQPKVQFLVDTELTSDRSKWLHHEEGN